jgi:hypothetical protein
MKSLKIIFLLLIIIFLIFVYFLTKKKTETPNPFSPKNEFQNRLNHALSLAKLETFNLSFRDYLNEAEFFINHQEKKIKVIISTEKNPYSQIATLQQVIKKDKMKIPKIIDLSSDKQYATF